MATRKKGLGRGLDALLGADNGALDAVGRQKDDSPSQLLVGALRAGRYQPRTRMDEGALNDLAESIRAQGIMQPILVRPLEDEPGQYEIIAGERRFRAARIAGLDVVPVLVRRVADENAAAMALIENIQREDLNPLEQAQAVKRLIDEFHYSHEQAAEAIGRSRSATAMPPRSTTPSADRRSASTASILPGATYRRAPSAPSSACARKTGL